MNPVENDIEQLRYIIGQNIRLRRRSLNVTQQDLADTVGYARRWVANLEQGRSSCPAECVPRLLKALKLPNFDALLKELD